jgi:hypothetical protein
MRVLVRPGHLGEGLMTARQIIEVRWRPMVRRASASTRSAWRESAASRAG